MASALLATHFKASKALNNMAAPFICSNFKMFFGKTISGKCGIFNSLQYLKMETSSNNSIKEHVFVSQSFRNSLLNNRNTLRTNNECCDTTFISRKKETDLYNIYDVLTCKTDKTDHHRVHIQSLWNTH